MTISKPLIPERYHKWAEDCKWHFSFLPEAETGQPWNACTSHRSSQLGFKNIYSIHRYTHEIKFLWKSIFLTHKHCCPERSQPSCSITFNHRWALARNVQRFREEFKRRKRGAVPFRLCAWSSWLHNLTSFHSSVKRNHIIRPAFDHHNSLAAVAVHASISAYFF